MFSLRLIPALLLCMKAALAGEVRPVTVAAAVSEPMARRLELTGSVTASQRSQLSPRIPGLILQMHVDAGDLVKQGDVLMELDPELAELELESLERELAQEKILLADAARLLAEGRDLASRGAFPKSEADSRDASHAVSEASVGQLEARVKLQRSIIGRHRLVAPYDGVISRRLADAGEWVQTGVAVFELVSMDRPRLDVRVPQEYVALIGPDTGVVLKLDAFPGQEHEGRVAALVPVKDDVSRTFLTRLEWKDQARNIGPGMSGKARFEIRMGRDVVRVERDAVVRFPDGSAKAWVVVDKGGRTTVHARDVELGDSLGKHVHVLRGLEQGERVVVRGNESLQEGQEVEIVEENPQPADP